MVNELYVSSYSSVTTPTDGYLSQAGMLLVLRCDALRGSLAYPPPVVSPFLQRFSRESVRRQGPQGSMCLPSSARRVPRAFHEARPFVRQSLPNTYVVSGSPHVCLLASLAGSLTLSIAYGVNVESEDDVFFSAADEAMSIADRAMMPGGFLVDAFPVRTCSSRIGYFRGISQRPSPQSDISRNGFPGPVSTDSRG